MAARLIIVLATYGGADVTQRVQDAAAKFSLSLPVSNDALGGDPKPGKGKTLDVKWSMGPKSGTVSAREGRTLTIDPAHG